MADDFRTIGTGRAGEVKSVTGSEAGKTAKYDRMAARTEEQRFKQAQGVGGLGNAGKASGSAFQQRLKAHMKKWRAARKKAAAAKAAKKSGQKSAASKLPKPTAALGAKNMGSQAAGTRVPHPVRTGAEAAALNQRAGEVN